MDVSQAVGKYVPWCGAAPLPPHLLVLVLHLLLLALFVPPLFLCGISKPSIQMLSLGHHHHGSRAQLCPELGVLEPSGTGCVPGLLLKEVTLQPPPAPGHLQCCAPAQLITKEDISLLTQIFWAPTYIRNKPLRKPLFCWKVLKWTKLDSSCDIGRSVKLNRDWGLWWGLRTASARVNGSGSGTSDLWPKLISLVLLEIHHSCWLHQDFSTSEKTVQANCRVTHLTRDGSPNSVGQRTLEPQCRAEQLQLYHLRAVVCFPHQIICLNHCWYSKP